MELPYNRTTDQLAEARRAMNMSTSRLEHALLQTIINHVAEEHLPREQIVMALINVSGYWQKKILLTALTKKLQEDADA